MMIKHQTEVLPRHEIKYVISGQEADLLSGRLEKLFRRDSHGKGHGRYLVTSLYFDDIYDSALRDKIDGTDDRRKYRLRYYGDDVSFIRLEKKEKRRGFCRKYSIRAESVWAEELISGEFGHIPYMDTDSPLLYEFCLRRREGLLRPRKVISYEREAFIYEPGNVRLTIDRDIRTSEVFEYFLSPDKLRPCELPASGRDCVLEVKYDRFLPKLASLSLQGIGRMSSACSKYAISFRYD